ncbi:hypothetical protein LINPERHAP1_LOCUS31657 [Linum perenne]
MDLVKNLGWSPAFYLRSSVYYPGPVRRFYANIRHHRSTPGHFTTPVYGELLTITLDLIGQALNLPTTGAGAEIDYILQSFNAHQALRLITPLAHSNGSSAPPNTVLDDTFRVLHFVLTDLFLPRGLYSEMLLPSDIWILQCALLGLRISLPHLMFRHMLERHTY